MWRHALQGLGELVAAPLAATVELLRSRVTGPRAILDVDLHRVEDVLQRQAIVHHLRRAATDPAVVGVLLRLRGNPGSWAAAQDLRGAIAGLRRSGRKVVAVLEAPGNLEIWIAAAADRVFLLPTGEVHLVGVGVELTFFGQALDRLGVEADLEAAGAYKSFGEPYTRTFASPANQEAVRHLVEDLHAQIVADVAADRGLEAAEVQALMARAPLTAEEARDAGLVDELRYEDEVLTWIEAHLGESTRRVDFTTWSRLDAVLDRCERLGQPAKRITVVHLEGPIVVDERGPAVMIRARRVVPVIRGLREDHDVAAVVLHVNSPGGSALASDLIWREVDLLRQKKPVVAVFEGVAASGGYYLAAPAHAIVARPGTLTGSIGVFGGKLVLGDALRRVGVHHQEVAAAPNANVFSPSRRFTEAQRERFRTMLQRVYDGFVERVAAGRNCAPAVVEPHCRGRVWTGRSALRWGLVDAFGDVHDGVDRARSLAGLGVGAFRRVDTSPAHNRTLLGRIVAALTREIVPGAARLRMAPVLRMLLTHEGKALAILPFDVDPR